MSQERKVILLGDSDVGKTSLLQKYLSPLDDICTQSPTIGSQFEKITIENDQNESIQLNVWDTAGQERYRSTIQLYMRDVQVAFICFDFKSPEITSISDWCKTLQSYSPDCVLFLVVTKIDLLNEDDKKKLHDFIDKTMSKTKMFAESFLTSAVSGEGINDLFKMAASVHLPDNNINRIDVQNF